MEWILHIDAPFFNAGVVMKNDKVIDAAPIIKYMIGWTERRVIEYADKRRWHCEGILKGVNHAVD